MRRIKTRSVARTERLGQGRAVPTLRIADAQRTGGTDVGPQPVGDPSRPERPGPTRGPRWVVLACLVFAPMLNGCCRGCCGGGDAKYSCTTGMDYKGASYSSKGTSSTSREAAKREAEAGVCLDYCQRGDPKVNAAWDKYKATPKGKRSSASKSFDLTFEPSLKTLYDTCKRSCEADVATNKVTLTTRCE